jgi:hypothetical protein
MLLFCAVIRNFTFMWPCIMTNFLIIKSTRRISFSNFILEMKICIFRIVPLSTIRSYSLYTQQCYMSYRFVDSFRAAGSEWKAVHKPVWHIPPLSVQWITPDDGQRNCPKHVDSHFQNKIWEMSESSWFYYKEMCNWQLRSLCQLTPVAN